MGKNINEKFYSKDGKYYDTQIEAVAANYAWDQQMGLQKEQNRLLEEQNRAINYQTQMEYQRLEQQRKLENEKIKLEHDKIQHEKEMRLFKLFDDAGISKKLYDKFINYLEFGGNEDVSKIKSDIINEHKVLKSSIEVVDWGDGSGDTYERINADIVQDNRNMFTKIIPDYFNTKKVKSKVKADLLKEYQEKKNKQKSKAKMYLVLAILSYIISVVGIIADAEVLVIFILSGTVLSVMSSRQYYNVTKINEDIKRCEEQLYDDGGKDVKEKYINSIKNRIEKLETDYSKLIEKDVDDFYAFRLNHYNGIIEKLLIDVGFDDFLSSYNIQYKKVNSSDKKKDGSIEDYTEYFSK